MANLIEPGVKYFLNETLKNCNKKRTEYNNNLFNITLFLIFFTFVSLILIYKFKTKPTKDDLEKKEDQKKYYILNKIKSLNEKAAKERMEIITNLPKFETYN
tara:strand:- start:3278 stop:3583 length:306 start_codon:yes stop_codon:yes gene_type:complete